MNQDIRTIRKNNLELLVAEARTVAELGRRSEVNETYLRQVRRGVGGKGRVRPRSLGDDVARKLEEGMNKPFGWMDQAHTEAGAEEQQVAGEVTAYPKRPSNALDMSWARTYLAAEPGVELQQSEWPFNPALLPRVLALSTYQRGMIEGKLRTAIEECESELSQARDAGTYGKR